MNFPVEVKKLLKYYQREIAGWPAADRVYYYTAAVEYFTILMRVYVFAGERQASRRRFREVMSDPFWKNVFRHCRLSALRGRCRLTGLLGKSGNGAALYLANLLYHRGLRRVPKAIR